MEKKVDLEQVEKAIRQLRERGAKASRRNVLEITGGSMKTVIKLMNQALANERQAAMALTPELSEDLVKAILVEIGKNVLGSTEALRRCINEMAMREQEILSDQKESDVRVAELEESLAATEARLCEERQAAVQAAAVTTEQHAGLREQLEKMTVEKDNLIRAGEMARTEAAKAQLQVERADLAAQKAEARVIEMEGRLVELTAGKVEAEKETAVAMSHARDLAERVSELTAQNVTHAKAIEKSTATVEQLRQELAESVQDAVVTKHHARELDYRVAELTETILAQAEDAKHAAAVIEQLRQELVNSRKLEALADKRAALAVLQLEMSVKNVEARKPAAEAVPAETCEGEDFRISAGA